MFICKRVKDNDYTNFDNTILRVIRIFLRGMDTNTGPQSESQGQKVINYERGENGTKIALYY
jgi:hypothetical protein